VRQRPHIENRLLGAGIILMMEMEGHNKEENDGENTADRKVRKCYAIKIAGAYGKKAGGFTGCFG
jgi:hypothetical protein